MADAVPDTEAVRQDPPAPIDHLGVVPPGPSGGKDVATAPPTSELADDPADEEPVPSLLARVALVLLHPVEAFSRLDERWGWLGIWGLLTLCGLVVSLVAVARVDIAAAVTAELEANMQPGTPPEARDLTIRGTIAARRIWLFAGPLLGPILSGVVVGGVLFAASWALGGRRQYLRAFVAAFHASLVHLPLFLARLLGYAAGNASPETSLVHTVDAKSQPFLALGLLVWVDPLWWWWVLLLGLALHLTMGVRRGRALAATLLLASIPVLAMLGMAALASFASKLGGRP